MYPSPPPQLRSLCLCLLAGVAGASAEWTQDAHDAQRTGFTPEDPKTPWTFAWTWNGPDENGGTGGHFYDAPREARTVTGGPFIYVPAGKKGLYALEKATGRPAWHFTEAEFGAAPAYDPASRHLFAGAANGKLYQLDAKTGKPAASYDARAALAKSVLLASGAVVVVDDSGTLHCVDAASMKPMWTYAAASPAATPPAYAERAGLLIFATEDLYVRAVAMADGKQRWRVKPTPNPAGFPNSFSGSWPVVAEKSGLVFLRMRLEHTKGLWGGPGPKSRYPDSNAEIRAFLNKNPALKNLFALRLADGAEAFVPATGYGGVEDLVDGQPYLNVGPVPVVRTTASGEEIAYAMFRNGQSRPPDGRWDSHLGEMSLPANPAQGLEPGDFRFVEFPNSTTRITDEQVPLTMAGDTLFRAHWGASESTRLMDRSPARGLSWKEPIRTQAHPPVVRRQTRNRDFNPASHWTKTGLTLFGDGRYWNGPGWWVYWNVLDPPTPDRPAYSDGLRPRYTYASDGLVIVQGNGGELFVLRSAEPEKGKGP